MESANSLVRSKGGSGAVPEMVWKSEIHWVNNLDRPTLVTPGALMAAAATHNWTIVDQVAATRNFTKDCFNDKIHFNEVGRTQLNENLIRTLRDAGSAAPL